MVDLYCERLGPGIWAEPVNAITNLLFLVAAWAIWRMANSDEVLSIDIWLLVGLTTSIAVGSILFHTLATSSARILDVVPILLFQLAFLWIYMRRIIGVRSTYVAGIIVIYLAVALWARRFPDLLNGSLAYAPAIAVLVSLGFYHYISKRAQPILLLGASLVFLASLVFRIADIAICPYFSLGTHFLWHIFNAAMLYILMKGLVANIKHS